MIATHNRGKSAEIARILSHMPLELMDLDSLTPVPAPEEVGDSFLENAVAKARFYADYSGVIALADDSGLEVDALDGRPGVRSARYGGDGLSDSDRMYLLLDELRSVPVSRRTARFVCSVAVAGADIPGGVITADGIVEGSIGFEPRGSNGFGYDPIFIPLNESRTTAEMSDDEKDELSHRGRALRALIPEIYEILV